MMTLDHPNIIQVYGVVIEPEASVYGIVMEYMHHGSVDRLIKKKPNMPYSLKVSVTLMARLYQIKTCCEQYFQELSKLIQIVLPGFDVTLVSCMEFHSV